MINKDELEEVLKEFLSKYNDCRYAPWTVQEERRMITLANTGITYLEIAEKLCEEFNTNRSAGVIAQRITKCNSTIVGTPAAQKKKKIIKSKPAKSFGNRLDYYNPVGEGIYDKI